MNEREPTSRGRYEGRAARATVQRRFRVYCIGDRYFLLDSVLGDGHTEEMNMQLPTLNPEKNSGGGRPTFKGPGKGIRRRQGYGGRGEPRNMCFCETNPPFFGRFFDVLPTARGSYGRNVAENSVGSFSKTNPPGRVF